MPHPDKLNRPPLDLPCVLRQVAKIQDYLRSEVWPKELSTPVESRPFTSKSSRGVCDSTSTSSTMPADGPKTCQPNSATAGPTRRDD